MWPRVSDMRLGSPAMRRRFCRRAHHCRNFPGVAHFLGVIPWLFLGVRAVGQASAISSHYGGRFDELLGCARGEPCGEVEAMLSAEPMEWLPTGFLPTWKDEQRTPCAKERMQQLRAVLVAWLGKLPRCSGREGEVGEVVNIVDSSPVGATALHLASDFYESAHCHACKARVKDNADWQFVAPRDQTRCEGGGWHCLFAPLNYDAQPETDVPESCGVSTEWPAVERLSPGNGPAVILPLAALQAASTQPSRGVAMWMRDATRERNAHLRKACASFPKISLHVRTEGGRCALEAGDNDGKITCTTVPVAIAEVQRVRRLYGSCSVLLATDNAAVAAELPAAPGSEDFHWMWVEWNRTQLESSSKPDAQELHQHVEHRGGLDWNVGFSMAADMALLSKGDIFVGGFDSMVGLAYYFGMVGEKGMLPPYVVPGGKQSKHYRNWLPDPQKCKAPGGTYSRVEL
eukprot:TRINITY_DN15096_c0_g1_i1.p1 TRINITY_DN15096_c0_g1~~TRINITY_DN15096_c0_g1_i1.p1  ORF type:complete len:459 (-),score=49.59 TRINITY_DN15096_c0_g1_i1:57-1433(-)